MLFGVPGCTVPTHRLKKGAPMLFTESCFVWFHLRFGTVKHVAENRQTTIQNDRQHSSRDQIPQIVEDDKLIRVFMPLWTSGSGTIA